MAYESKLNSSGKAEDLASSVDEIPCFGEGRVLLVDDNRDLLSVLKNLLENSGFEVVTADDGSSAIEKLQHFVPDIIVCDIMMPGLNGYELHDRLSEQEECCHIPFLFLTALSSPTEIRYGKSMGCDDYLVKPFDPVELETIIRGKIKKFRKRKTMSAKHVEQYRKRIIHTLSHEFRTPLVAINTGAELLKDNFKTFDEERLLTLFESIQRGGARLEHLVNDFMTLRQIDSGSAESVYLRLKRPLDFGVMTRNCLEALENQLIDREPAMNNVQVENALSGKCNVEVYEGQFKDILARLLDNAIKFGEGKPVSIILSDDSTRVYLSIIDQGPGLSEQVRKAACQLFGQINREQFEQQGCGLGLTIACYFTELNGGKLEFRKAESCGLEVVVSFPKCVS